MTIVENTLTGEIVTTNGTPARKPRVRSVAPPPEPTAISAYRDARKALETRREELVAELKALTEVLGPIAPTKPEAPKAEPKPRKPKTERKPRAASSNVAELLATVLDYLKDHPEGQRSEDIRKSLDCDKGLLAKALKAGVTDGSLKTTGQKRATVYTKA